jgi:hypothetical protein
LADFENLLNSIEENITISSDISTKFAVRPII